MYSVRCCESCTNQCYWYSVRHVSCSGSFFELYMNQMISERSTLATDSYFLTHIHIMCDLYFHYIFYIIKVKKFWMKFQDVRQFNSTRFDLLIFMSYHATWFREFGQSVISSFTNYLTFNADSNHMITYVVMPAQLSCVLQLYIATRRSKLTFVTILFMPYMCLR